MPLVFYSGRELLSEIRCWKKVFVNDLESVVYELKECIDVPSMIVLSGPLGSGKTTFVQTFVKVINARSEGGGGRVLSPTYSLINEVGSVVHADFYRLKNEDEIVHLEIPLYLEGKDYFLVEWGEAYLHSLREQVGSDFSYYQLKIEVGEFQENSFRHFSLHKIEA